MWRKWYDKTHHFVPSPTATLIKVSGDVQLSMNKEPFHTRRDDPAEIYRLRISRYLDRDFLDAFRSDLAGSDSRVIILSPFLSPNRASDYSPVIHALAARRSARASWACGGGITSDGAQSAAGGVALFAQVDIACPVCGADMDIIRGVFLRAACTSRECGFSLDSRIASSLLRVLKRRRVA